MKTTTTHHQKRGDDERERVGVVGFQGTASSHSFDLRGFR